MSAVLNDLSLMRHHRRAALSAHPGLKGLDYIDVLMDGSTLDLYFVPPAKGIKKDAIPDIGTANIRIEGALGDPVTFTVESIHKLSVDHKLNMTITVIASTGTASRYTLKLINLPDMDPFFTEAEFSLNTDEPRAFDCAKDIQPQPISEPAPEIDYLAKDYASFRKLMLDRLSLIIPQWREGNAADWPVAVVEAIAVAADHLSYYQDAVATEAYLGTARRRISVKRHARLLDYKMHEGCNARTWVVFEVKDGEPVYIKRGTRLLTRLEKYPVHIPLHSDLFGQAMAENPEMFEILHTTKLSAQQNRLGFYSWGARELWLEKGTTSAALAVPGSPGSGDQELRPGDVLIFEELLGPSSGKEYDADPEHRHAVRLTSVTSTVDPLYQQLGNHPEEDEKLILNIEWRARDALRFPMCVSTVINGELVTDVSVVRGNVAAVEHGRSYQGDALQPEVVPEDGHYRPRLQRRGITYSVPYDDEESRSKAATDTLIQDPIDALPAVTLKAMAPQLKQLHESNSNEDAKENVERESFVTNIETWTPQTDLLTSNRFARNFLVEMDEDGSAHLRFGDGIRGRQPIPASRFTADYHIGNGAQGNIGRDTLAHIIVEAEEVFNVKTVRNPLPARGGINPEPIEQVKYYAPNALQTPERCVTEADYMEITLRHPLVGRAKAQRIWTGSWHTMYVAIERKDDRPVDNVFKNEIREFLERYRIAGADIHICSPHYVAVKIVLTVHLHPDYFPSKVRQELVEIFSNAEFADGRKGFFHRGKRGFGQSIYLSHILETAINVPGVAWVDLARETIQFQRMGQPPGDEIEKGLIEAGPFEILSIESDADSPENGMIDFIVQGGL